MTVTDVRLAMNQSLRDYNIERIAHLEIIIKDCIDTGLNKLDEFSENFQKTMK